MADVKQEIEQTTARATARADEAARRGAETVRQGGRAAAQAVRQGTQAGAEVLGRDSDTEVVTETARRSAQAQAEGQRQITQEAAQTFEQVSRQVAEAARGTSEDLQRFLVLPQAAEGGLRDVQQSVAGLVEGVVWANLRVAQELLRLTDPAAMADVQQRFTRDYLDTLVTGTTTLMRAVRRTADELLRPLEEQVQQIERRHRQAPQ